MKPEDIVVQTKQEIAINEESSEEEQEDSEIDGKPIIDSNGEKLIHFKTSNLLNAMLPYAQNGPANVNKDAEISLGKRPPTTDT